MNNINYSLSLKVANYLKSKNRTLAIAESCTGGGLATEITAVSGASAYFDRGFVTYTNEAKQELLDVPQAALDQHGAVSAEVAKAMAEGVLAHSRADIALSITGIAGPAGGTADKPVGLVWFALAERGGSVEAREAYFGGGRKQIRRLSIGFALEWILEVE